MVHSEQKEKREERIGREGREGKKINWNLEELREQGKMTSRGL